MQYSYSKELGFYAVFNWAYDPVDNSGVTTTPTTSMFTGKIHEDEKVRYLEVYEEGDVFNCYENGIHFCCMAKDGALHKCPPMLVNTTERTERSYLLYRPLNQGEIACIKNIIGSSYEDICDEINRQMNGKVKGFCSTEMLFKARLLELIEEDSRKAAAYMLMCDGFSDISSKAQIDHWALYEEGEKKYLSCLV